jgi:hypothetical protein
MIIIVQIIIIIITIHLIVHGLDGEGGCPPSRRPKRGSRLELHHPAQ